MKLSDIFALPKKAKVIIAQIILFILIAIGFYFWKGTSLVILFFLIWLDKVVLIHLKIHGELGVELITLPVIIVGMIYGPAFGFLFGFLALALLGGFMEMLSWLVSQPFEVRWPPILPSPDTFATGMAGFVGGAFTDMNLMMVVLIAVVIKNLIQAIVHKITTDEPTKMAFVLNIIFNMALALAVGNYLLEIVT